MTSVVFLEFSCECSNEHVKMDLVSGNERGKNVTHYLLRRELDELDERFSFCLPGICKCTYRLLMIRFIAIPSISKLHHFLNGVCKLKYITAREQGIILRVIHHGAQGFPSAFLTCATSTSLRSPMASVKRKIGTH